jgi:G:T-mismatch repair DNA endonuclease (very short patch repair protein)
MCNIHGSFWQTPSNHIKGSDCPKCAATTSKMEIKWLDILGIYKKYRQSKIKIGNKNIIADAYVPETNTVYEFHGDYWHGNPKIYDPNDLNNKTNTTFGFLFSETIKKENLIKSAGYNLVVIWESDFKYHLKQ